MSQRPHAVILAAALMALALGGCTTTTPPSKALGLRPAQTGAAPSDDRVSPPADSATPFGLYLAGEAAIDAGSSRAAASYFAKASQLEPGEDAVRARAFSSALVAGEIDRASEAARGLGQGDQPIQQLARLTLAVDDLAADQGKPAYALLSGPVPDTAHALPIRLMKPWAAAAAGDWAAATASSGDLGDPVDNGVAELQRAELLEKNGRFAEAEAILKLHADGKNGLFVLGYGGFLERRGRKAEAMALYDKAVAANTDNATFRFAKARVAAGKAAVQLPTFRQGAAEALIPPAAILAARRQGDSGLAYLRLALKLDPTLDEAWLMVGDAMDSAGDTQSAKDAYGKVRPASDQYVAARGRLALLAQQGGDKDGALVIAREMMAAAPQDPRPMVLYADLLRDDERYAEAVPVLDRAIAAIGDNAAGWSLFFDRGVAEERAGDWPKAEADLQRALKIKPDEPQVLNYLGYAWADRGEHLKEALGMLERAVSLEPRSGAIIDSLGWARYRIHQYRDALRDLEQAVLLAPADPEVNGHLGDVYWRMGRQLEARFQWGHVLTLDPDAKTKAATEIKLARGLDPDTAPAVPSTEGVARQ